MASKAVRFERVISTIASALLRVFPASCTPPSSSFPVRTLTAARGELLAWLNDLLAPNVITKVEECGKGVIYCQVSLCGQVLVERVGGGTASNVKQTVLLAL